MYWTEAVSKRSELYNYDSVIIVEFTPLCDMSVVRLGFRKGGWGILLNATPKGLMYQVGGP